MNKGTAATYGCFCIFVAIVMTSVYSAPPGESPRMRYTLPPKEAALGVAYSPNVLIDGKPIGPGLADWGARDESGHLDIQEIRLVGFPVLNEGYRLDWVTKDKRNIDVVESCFTKGYMQRPPVSDLSQERGSTGYGTHLGIIIIKLPKRSLIVGVGYNTFYLGSWHGTPYQMFSSWTLAKQLDDMLFEATGNHLKYSYFSDLSGESTIRRQKKAYFKSFKKRPDKKAE